MMFQKFITLSVFALTALIPTASVNADQGLGNTLDLESQSTSVVNIEEQLQKAQELFDVGHFIDGRAILQKIVRKAPEDHRAHLLLGAYYLSEVAHFRLALKYLLNAEELFHRQYPLEKLQQFDRSVWQQHARLLFLLSEARLNLDDYEGSLETMNRFSQRYWDEWYPGTKAWVLMKLRRYDEAIQVAQAGLARSFMPSRTYNILGILLSLKDNRELALKAFGRAIQFELSTIGRGYVATPLNNAGEVYRELFRDRKAEAAWRRAIDLPDGCEHILPSLNLATLSMDELRLFQAERVLNDFEACFASQSLRQDTEHRALIRMGRGRLALRKGEFEQSLENLRLALDRKQWFGKIGTSQDDLRLAALSLYSYSLKANAAAQMDEVGLGIFGFVERRINRLLGELRAWWALRQARQLGVERLEDFEDLFIRHTDAMLEYPTLGRLFSGFSLPAVRARMKHMIDSDSRLEADNYYLLYLARAELEHGEPEDALKTLSQVSFREFDRLARAEQLVITLRALTEQSWFWERGDDYRKKRRSLVLQLYSLSPAMVRAEDLSLPVAPKGQLNNSAELSARRVADNVRSDLLERRFSRDDNSPYLLSVSVNSNHSSNVTITLRERGTGNILAKETADIEDSEERFALVNRFIDKAFLHRVDPQAEALPRLDILGEK